MRSLVVISTVLVTFVGLLPSLVVPDFYKRHSIVRVLEVY